MGLRDTEPSILDLEDASPEDAEDGVAGNLGDEPEPEWAPKSWRRAMGKASDEVGRLRSENAQLRQMLEAGGCTCADPAEAGKGPWKLARKLTRRVRDLERERDRLLTELHPHRVSGFLAEKGLPEKVAGLIGDRDPEEWFAEFGETLTRTRGE
jgi:hypothetical protein